MQCGHIDTVQFCFRQWDSGVMDIIDTSPNIRYMSPGGLDCSPTYFINCIQYYGLNSILSDIESNLHIDQL